MDSRASLLVQHLDLFLGFVRRRVRDPDLAADIVQDALVRALDRIDDLADEDRLLPWFWRILRHTVADAMTRRGAAVLADGDLPAPTPAEEAAACACLGDAIADLPPDQRIPIERVDLAGEDADRVAADLGLTPNHLKVIRHRVRTRLRDHLHRLCRLCAAHGCLDCSCRRGP